MPIEGTLKRTGCITSTGVGVTVTDGVLAVLELTRSGGSSIDGSWALVREPHAAKKSKTALMKTAQICRK
jgi:hypothetical protein